MLHGMCPRCMRVYHGWALQQEEHQYCEAHPKIKLIIWRGGSGGQKKRTDAGKSEKACYPSQ